MRGCDDLAEMRAPGYIKEHWRWGPLTFGVGTGLSVWTWWPVLGATFILGGLTVTLALVVGPALANALSSSVVARAHRRQGLQWPPPAPGEPTSADYRQALQEVAVELENNEVLLRGKVVENRVWNAANRPVAAAAYSRHSTLLARSRDYAALFQGLSTLYNDFSALNYAVKRHFNAALNKRADSSFEEDDIATMSDLAQRSSEMRELVLNELGNI